jgi:catechol 2,3-dioxygenase-like lactoylglutathione lyase family enzyme
MTRGSLDHVGIVVHDISTSLAFYRDLLGLKVTDEGVGQGPDLDTLLGAAGVKLRFAELDLGRGQILELLSDETAAGASSDGPLKVPGVPACGLVHFAVQVQEIADVVKRLRKAGYSVRSDPVTLHEEGRWSGAKAVYAWDPDGAMVELISLPGE